ncbi:hypothetical protein COY95_00250 [Candidatus Woesearchaeota archaeon CG_4_10_14_0_8_um_filter_47_5]|nr:MAG: hypothetical protein COY95_00250 [Candidatus Woesearchaeota archaeon CG_4_10_14_0_8_um_filter_47_5]
MIPKVNEMEDMHKKFLIRPQMHKEEPLLSKGSLLDIAGKETAEVLDQYEVNHRKKIEALMRFMRE